MLSMLPIFIIFTLLSVNAIVVDILLIRQHFINKDKDYISPKEFKKFFKQDLSEFITKKYTLETSFNARVNSIIRQVTLDSIRKIVLLYGESISEDVEQEQIIFQQDILELYLYRNFGEVISTKLRSLFNRSNQENLDFDSIELSNKVETITTEIIDSVVLGLSEKELKLNNLADVLNNSSKTIFNLLRNSIKEYLELNHEKTKEVNKLMQEQSNRLESRLSSVKTGG